MHIPLEILEQIIGNFVVTYPAKWNSSEELSWNPSDFAIGGSKAMWDGLIDCDSVAFNALADEPYTTPFVTRDYTYDLLNCRLVSRDWKDAAARAFANADFFVFFDDDAKLKRALRASGGSGTRSGTRSGLGHSIRKLHIGDICNLPVFRRSYNVDDDGELESYEDSFLNEGSDWTEVAPKPARLRDISAKVNVLGRILECARRVEQFSFQVDGLESEYYSEDETFAECMDIKNLDAIIRRVARALSSGAYANHIVDLRLAVPSTWYVGPLAKALASGGSGDALSRLRHLRINITDNTGMGGCIEYLSYIELDNHDGSTEEEDGIPYSGVPPSNIQVERPNQEHQDLVWDFVASCPNLESLAVHATHHLDLDRLAHILADRPLSTLANLRVLALSRVYVSVHSLQSLIPRRNIRRLSLWEAKMRGEGTWADCFTFLRRACPALDWVCAYQLTYFEDHPLFAQMQRPGENLQDIWTGTYDPVYGDSAMRRKLMRKLCRRAGGRDRYPGGDEWDHDKNFDKSDHDEDGDDEMIDEMEMMGLGARAVPIPIRRMERKPPAEYLFRGVRVVPLGDCTKNPDGDGPPLARRLFG